MRAQTIMDQNFSSLEQDNCRDFTHVPTLMQCFIHKKFNFEKKVLFFPLRNFSFLYQSEIRLCYHTLLSILCSICQLVAYGRLKIKEKFKLLAIEVVVVAYERWLRTRGFKYSDLTWKLLVFWKTGRLREAVTTRGLTVGSHYFSKYVENSSFQMIVIYENTVIAFYIIYLS